MSTKAKDKDRVHRLSDIVVEEVSLVDRAANKHRFLIVKRSDDMDETTNETGDTTSQEEQQGGQAGAVGAASTTGAEQTSEQPAGGQESDALGVALEALEGLTEAVETLHTLDEAEAGPRLAEIAGQLQTASEQLTTMAGQSPGGGDGAGGQQQEGSGDGRASGQGGKDLADVIAAVRATLQRVGSLMDAGGKGTGAGQEGTAAVGGEAGGQQQEGAGGESGQAGGSLANEIRALADTVRAQQQRLARLEKRSGLPNSAASGEQPPHARDEDEDVGWPMDLNRPYDRKSVDKAVSFHDV